MCPSSWAGLPGAVSTTLNDKVLTFLNRARKVSLPPLEQGEVDAFFKRSFDSLGIAIESGLRRSASAYTAGSPYLLQLVGHYTCLYAEDGKVSEESLARGAANLRRRFPKRCVRHHTRRAFRARRGLP